MRYKKIIIKIGTNVITRENGKLDLDSMKKIVGEIAELKKNKIEVVVVSSGAMGAGRGVYSAPLTLSDIEKRQILAAVGQPVLMHEYLKLFSGYELICAQVLATKEDFRDREHYLNMRNCFESLLREGITPIVNENDAVSVDELMFTDNDELAGLVASMMSADALIILTSVPGVLKKGSDDPKDVLPIIRSLKELEGHISSEKSSFGRGGMATKVHLAAKLARLGITTHIVRGGKERVLEDVLKGKQVGTTFVPSGKKLSPVKRWVAQSEGREQGAITVNDCAEEILKNKKKAVSLLPVGVVRVEGAFKKGHIVKICNERGEPIGYGVAQYDAKRAGELMGKKGGKELIHYDTLFIYD